MEMDLNKMAEWEDNGRWKEGKQRQIVLGTIKLASTDQEGPFNLALFRVICVELG